MDSMQAGRESELQREMVLAEKEVALLVEVMKAISDRLIPVLRPESPEPKGVNKECELSPESSRAGQVRALRCMITQERLRLDSLLNRLEA
jgi:hypothetical protein